jgi:hypothetical protein
MEPEMRLILFVLHDPEKFSDLLDAWKEAGVAGDLNKPDRGLLMVLPVERMFGLRKYGQSN